MTNVYKTLDFTINGISPLMFHNGHLADPLNPFAQAMKKVSGKRKKTEEDYAEMSRIEFAGSLYLDEEKRVSIPGENIERMFVDAGKKQRLGNEFKSGVLCDGVWPIDYEGPREADKLFKESRFVDRRGVKVQQSRVIRTRPIFHQWKLSFKVDFLPSVLNPEQVGDVLATAGRIIGLGDYRPRFGRFEIV